jgi:GT2 family glycosyltransferase
MRNKIVGYAFRHEWPRLVICDDDFLFAPDFLHQLESFRGKWDILCPRIENPDGTRYWDWATCEGKHGHQLMPYNWKVRTGWYATGGLFVAKTEVFRQVKWPEDRTIGQSEDAAFGKALMATGFHIKALPRAVAVHDDPTLTSDGKVVRAVKGEPDDRT